MVFRRPHSWRSTPAAGLALSLSLRAQVDAGRPFRVKVLGLAVTCALGTMTGVAPWSAASAWAAESAASTSSRDYAIPAGRLSDVLAQFAAMSGVLLSFDPQVLDGKRSSGLQGHYSVRDGFARLLEGSGFELIDTGGGRYALRTAGPDRGAVSVAPATLAPVQVVGTAETLPGELMPAYAGGQVARGGAIGILGNRDIMDTPFSMTTFTSTLMKQQQAESLADVVANDASVQNTNPRTSRFDQYSIRGFPVLNSDISLNGLYSVLPTYALAVESVERVEVLKGATALLYGMAPSGGVGGAINVVPKRAGETPTRDLTTSYASDSTVGAHLDLGQRFGEQGEFGIRVNGAYRTGGTSVSHQSQQRGLLTVGLDYRMAHTRLSADIGHQDRSVYSPQERVGVAATAPVPDAERLDRGYAPDWTFSKSRDSYVALRAEHDLSARTMVYGAYGLRKGKYDFLRMNVSAQNAAGDFSTRPNYFLRDETVHTGEVGVRSRFETGAVSHSLVVSASHFDKSFGNLIHSLPVVSSNLYHPLPTSAPSIDGLSRNIPKSGESRLTSLAIADTLSMWDERVQVTVGGRLQRVITDAYDAGVFATRYDEQAFTPAVALLVRPREHLSLYANYIEGLSEGPTAPDHAENAEEVFAPIKSKQAEAGIKLDYGRVGGSLSVFQIRKPNGLTDPVSNVFAINGLQRNRGIELNVYGEPVRHVRVLAGMMYMDRRLLNTANPLTEGNVAPGTPRYTFNAGVEWDTPFAPGLTLTARALHNTTQYLDAANTKSIPGWTRFDLGARYAFKPGGLPMTLSATVSNVFDKSYWASASSNGLTIGAPRTVMVSASFSF